MTARAVGWRAPRFPLGTRFIPTGKRQEVLTVVDVLRTYNNDGELVRIRYVAAHQLMGQIVLDRDVIETTIARGLVT